jgi:phosphonatase-like hydrolase
MYKQFKAVVFDMAGTTVQDKGNVAEAFSEAFSHYKMNIPKEEIQKVMGWRKIDAIKMLLEIFADGDLKDKSGLAQPIHDRFTGNMIQFYTADPHLIPLPHAEEVFAILQDSNINVALNTGFTRAITDVILKRLQWDSSPLIDVVVTSDEVPEGRPHPFMIDKIMRQLGLTERSAIVKVGDTEVDILEGRSAGCGLVVAVTSGAYTREKLETYSPDAIINDLAELPPLIV